MLLDMHGKVVRMGGGDPKVFGFNPSYLVGRSLASCVDIFKEAEELDKLNGDVGASSAAHKLLKCLVSK